MGSGGGLRRRCAAVLLAVAVVAGACSATGGRAVSGRGGPARRGAAAVGADHDCIVSGAPRPVVDWSQVHNPVLSSPTAGEKDPVMVWDAGSWHLVFSYLRLDPSVPGGVDWDIATSSSPDLVSWSPPVPWPAQPGTLGVAGPQLVRAPGGEFVVSYQSDPGETSGAQDRLYYRTTRDFVTWSAAHPLAHSLAPAPGDRMIDGSLAWTGHGLILGYKAGAEAGGQAFEIAWSPDGSLAGPWHPVGKPDIVVTGDTVERYEFLEVAGSWHLMATSNQFDHPWLFRLVGDPATPSGWLRWTTGHELVVPSAAWDSGPGISGVNYERANAAFLCNATADDGYYYLVYAGSRELTAFGGWGQAELGIARSRNLVDWQLPPG